MSTLRITLLTALFLAAGCRATYDARDGHMQASTGIVVTETKAADGAITRSIDTTGYGWTDRIRETFATMINYLGRALDQTQPEIAP